MTKCDFCSYYYPAKKHCNSHPGSGACSEAAARFLSFQRSKNSHTHTHNKNVNINKKNNKPRR
jgi:hypothetical protein